MAVAALAIGVGRSTATFGVLPRTLPAAIVSDAAARVDPMTVLRSG